jgi:hypothetical protein
MYALLWSWMNLRALVERTTLKTLHKTLVYMTYSNLVESNLKSIVLAPQLFQTLQRDLYSSLVDAPKGVHLLLLFPCRMSLSTIPGQTSRWSHTARRAYFSGLNKINVLSPYFATILILADVHESEIVCLADHLARRGIRIHTSLGKT